MGSTEKSPAYGRATKGVQFINGIEESQIAA
jgi:hypothetical protein